MSNSLRPHGLYSPWNSPGQNAGVCRCSLLQGIFPTQGSNPGLPHHMWVLYQLSHKESPQLLQKWSFIILIFFFLFLLTFCLQVLKTLGKSASLFFCICIGMHTYLFLFFLCLLKKTSLIKNLCIKKHNVQSKGQIFFSVFFFFSMCDRD